MRIRVLVVDDQQYLRDIITAILEDAGYPTLAVATPAEALRSLDVVHPDLLILDVSLPGMSGLEFLDRLRATEAWHQIPVIMVSGDAAKLVAAERRKNVVVLTKPFDVSALLAEVGRLLGPPALTHSA
jgi:CheY-like chemotaxis protein